MERTKTTRGWTDIKAMKEESAKHPAQNASRLPLEFGTGRETRSLYKTCTSTAMRLHYTP